jgi:hypothetical protein
MRDRRQRTVTFAAGCKARSGPQPAHARHWHNVGAACDR